MIQIRKGVFETNSSSSHSIVMMKRDAPTENKVDGGWWVGEDGVIDFSWRDELEFGRTPFDLLTDWYGRLRYCIASYSSQDDKIAELEEICKERIDGFSGFKFGKDRYGGGPDRGYVDHQSYGILNAALKRFNASLEDFIFNDRYIVVIDGDEYNVFDTLIETDMFNSAAVKDVVGADFEFVSDDEEEKE